MNLFDTHAHLLDRRFDIDRHALAASLPEKGIQYVLEAGTDSKQAQAVLDFVRGYPFMVCALGTHPHDVAGMEEADIERLVLLLADPRVVAVGEIGLDYHYDFSPREAQRYWFERQLALAGAHQLPVVLHVREASEDALGILRAHRANLRGVMHCFSGSYETARACLDMGLYIAFGGALTFKNAKRNVEVAAKVPLERLLIETDCPYMAPEPHRSRRNDPSLVSLVCERLAAIKGVEPAAMAHATLQNGLRLFGMPCIDKHTNNGEG